MTSKPTIYLAGPVAAMVDGGAGWRDDIKEMFGAEFDFRDPLSKYNVPAEDLEIVPGLSDSDDETTVGVYEIVEGDKQLLEESDGVLVGFSHVHSIGTPMEVMWAYERDYPVALWLRDDTRRDELSPWYRYHATSITTDPGAGLGHIDRQLSEVVR